jgi:hypothetical protein
MPFIVTTKRPCNCDGDPHIGSISRRAVATLEEARESLTAEVLAAYGDRRDVEFRNCNADARCLPGSGGTTGPLPNGTVIEVEALSPLMLSARAGISGAEAMACLRADNWQPIIDAFNAREQAR